MRDSLVGIHRRGYPFSVLIAIVAACLGFAAMGVQAHAQEKPAPDQPPAFEPLRYDEDYAYLRDPSARTGDRLALEPLKFIPLNPAGDRYLSLGGEIRAKYDLHLNPVFGQTPEDDDGYLLQRYLLHGDLHLGPSFRVFTQLRGAYAAFHDGPRVPIHDDGFDVQQAFFDLRTTRGSAAVTLRTGRQELSYGTERLISSREAGNVRRAFDAVRVLAAFEPWRVDGFYSRPVVNTPDSLDDWFDPGTELWGVYATGPTGRLQGMQADVYYLGLDRREAAFNRGTADEHRHTVGARLFGTPGALDYNFEAMYQWGSFGQGDIRAWGLGSDTGYTFASAPLAPRIALRADVTSGDRGSADDELRTFNPLLPRGNYFGESSTLGPMNVIDLQPMLQLQFTEAVSLTTGWGFFWRQSRDDGIYSNALTLIQAGDGGGSRHIGHELSLRLDWQANRHVSASASYALFSAGSFLKDAGLDDDVNFYSVSAKYQF